MLQNLDGLLKLCQEIVDKHTDRDVLDTCAKTLELLCQENNAIHSRCNVARGTVIDMIVNKYKEAMDDYSSLVAGVRWADREGWLSLSGRCPDKVCPSFAREVLF